MKKKHRASCAGFQTPSMQVHLELITVQHLPFGMHQSCILLLLQMLKDIVEIKNWI